MSLLISVRVRGDQSDQRPLTLFFRPAIKRVYSHWKGVSNDLTSQLFPEAIRRQMAELGISIHTGRTDDHPLDSSGGNVDLSVAVWEKSSRSGTNGCVEVAFVDGRVALRDSKDRDAAVLLFSLREWEAFLGGVADGQFRRLTRGSD
jgi:hypothetical protein